MELRPWIFLRQATEVKATATGKERDVGPVESDNSRVTQSPSGTVRLRTPGVAGWGGGRCEHKEVPAVAIIPRSPWTSSSDPTENVTVTSRRQDPARRCVKDKLELRANVDRSDTHSRRDKPLSLSICRCGLEREQRHARTHPITRRSLRSPRDHLAPHSFAVVRSGTRYSSTARVADCCLYQPIVYVPGQNPAQRQIRSPRRFLVCRC